MKVAIVGAKERDTEEDRRVVDKLIEQIAAEAPHTVFVTMMTHLGVGKFVKDKILLRDPGDGHYLYSMIECSVRVYARGMAKPDLVQIYLARNATPFEMSDMLIYLASEDRRGTCEELLERFEKSGRPTLVLGPGDPIPANILDAVGHTDVPQEVAHDSRMFDSL